MTDNDLLEAHPGTETQRPGTQAADRPGRQLENRPSVRADAQLGMDGAFSKPHAAAAVATVAAIAARIGAGCRDGVT